MKQTHTNLGMNTFILDDFGSIHDYLKWLEETPISPKFKRKSLDSIDGSKSWTGTDSYEQAMELMGSGWNVVAAKIAKKLPVQTQSGTINRPRPFYNVTGHAVSVPRYIQGLPTSMIDKKNIPVKSKIIVINRDISFHAGWKNQDIIDNGIKALQVIQGLENRGYRVRLNVAFASRSGDFTHGLRITVKKPEERLSINKLAFPIANTSMLRRLGFAWLERAWVEKYPSAYGTPATNDLKDVLDKKEVFIPHSIPDVDKFIEEVLKQTQK